MAESESQAAAADVIKVIQLMEKMTPEKPVVWRVLAPLLIVLVEHNVALETLVADLTATLGEHLS